MPRNVTFHSVPRIPRWRAAVRGIFLLAAGRFAPRIAYRQWYWRRRDVRQARQILTHLDADVIVANEWSALPVAVETAAGTGARAVVDLHEYSPLKGEYRWYWRQLYRPLIEHHLHGYLSETAGSMAVNATIADRYRADYGIEPIVVRNIPSVRPAPPRPRPAGGMIRLVHHGAAIRDRRIERMIDIAARLQDRFTLDLMLVPTQPGYLRWLVDYARRACPGRVTFRSPVLPADIVPTLEEYDIGLCVLAPTTFNHLVSLPNKLFEFLAAGLAVVTGPSPEMVRVLEQTGAGAAASDFTPETVASLVNSLDLERIRAFQNAAAATRFDDVQRQEIGRAADMIADLIATGRRR